MKASSGSPYVERLAVPRRWYAYGAVLALCVGAPFAAHAGDEGPTVAVYAVFVLGLWAVLRAIAPTVRLEGDVLAVAGRRLDARTFVRVEPLDAAALRAALAPAAAGGGTLLTRWWVKLGLRILTRDADGRQDVWVVTTRHPLMLADALRRSAGHPVVVGRALRAQDRASFVTRLEDLRARLAVQPPAGEPDAGWSPEVQAWLVASCDRLRSSLVRGERLAGTDIPDLRSRLSEVDLDSALADDLCWTFAQLAAAIGVAPSYRAGQLLPR